MFDLSRKEQISFIFRYDAENGTINERLLALHDSSITSETHLVDMFESVCEKLDLDWRNCFVGWLVGQSYDGTQNMRGKFNRLQTLIKKKKCFTATYTC